MNKTQMVQRQNSHFNDKTFKESNTITQVIMLWNIKIVWKKGEKKEKKKQKVNVTKN